MSAILSAERWNGLIREVLRARSIAGIGCETEQTDNGCIISGSGVSQWRHPWQVHPSWKTNPKIQPLGGQWTATVWPGFVNATDVTIEVEREVKASETARVQVPLTDEDPPELAFSEFRDPVASAGSEETLEGEIVIKPAEGYPPFFNQLGVVPAAKGGVGTDAMQQEPDPNRTRQIRACDIALVTPRMATHQQVDLRNPLTDSQSVEISTVFDNTALLNAKSRHWLIATSKWKPPQAPTALDRLMGTAVEPQTDEIKIATVWMVSPPDAGSDTAPDDSWTAYPQHFVFWNLNCASRAQMPVTSPTPITLKTGLAAGMADSIFSALLSPVNDSYTEISAYLNAADSTGLYWST